MGIDPGSRNFAWALIDLGGTVLEFGTLDMGPPQRLTIDKSVQLLHMWWGQVVVPLMCRYTIRCVSVEVQMKQKMVSIATTCLNLARSAGLQTCHISPKAVKVLNGIEHGGSNAANKRLALEMIKRELWTDCPSHHLADAFLTARAHLVRQRLVYSEHAPKPKPRARKVVAMSK